MRLGQVAHHQEGDNDRNKRETVDEKGGAFAGGSHQQTGGSRSNCPRPVEHGGIQPDGIGQVRLAFHQVHGERLAGGQIHRLDGSQEEREHIHLPDLHHARPNDNRQPNRLQHQQHLADQDDGALGHAVGKRTAPQRQGQERDETEQAHQSQGGCRTRQPVDEHLLRHRLHPGANQGNALPDEPEAVIAVT